MIHTITDEPAPDVPAMHCEILMTTGAEAIVNVTVIGVEGERRVPSCEEFYHIVRCLAKHQFALTLPRED